MRLNDDERDVALHLHYDGEAITGRLAAEGEEERPFTGWLGLLSALEALRPRPRTSGPQGQGPV